MELVRPEKSSKSVGVLISRLITYLDNMSNNCSVEYSTGLIGLSYRSTIGTIQVKQ